MRTQRTQRLQDKSYKYEELKFESPNPNKRVESN